MQLLGNHKNGFPPVLARACLVNTLKAFFEVGLHPVHVLGLRQNGKELVVGEEVQPREHRALGFEVVAQALLDLVKELGPLPAG